MIEKWKYIEGYEGIYQVSNLGRVKRKRFLKPYIASTGYYVIPLSKNGLVKRRTIHSLIAKAFIPNPKNKPQINHKNGIKNDNRIENLEWCTAKENAIHAVKTGLFLPKLSKEAIKKGSRISGVKSRKITYEQAEKMRGLRKIGKTIQYLADLFSVDYRTAWNILNNKQYRYAI